MKSTRRDFFGIGAAIAAIAVGANRVVAAPAIPAEIIMPEVRDALAAPVLHLPVPEALAIQPAFEWQSWPLETENDLVMSNVWLYMANDSNVNVTISHPDGMVNLTVTPSSPFHVNSLSPYRYVVLPVDGLKGPITLTVTASEGRVFGLGHTATWGVQYDNCKAQDGGMVAYSLRREKALERKNRFQYPLPPIKDEYLSGGDALNRGDMMMTDHVYFNPRDPNCFVDGVAPNMPELPAWATLKEFKNYFQADSAGELGL